MDARLPLALALALAACGADESDTSQTSDTGNDTGATPGTDPALADRCGSIWGADTCADGCADSTQALFAEGYLLHLAEGWALERDQVDGFAHVRSVEIIHQNDEVTARPRVQFTFGWVDFIADVYSRPLPETPADPTAAAAAFRNYVPQVDPFATPRRYDELDAIGDECAAEHGVVFDESEWCEAYVPMEPDHEEGGVRFSLSGEISEEEWAEAHLDAFDGEWDRCNTYERHY